MFSFSVNLGNMLFLSALIRVLSLCFCVCAFIFPTCSFLVLRIVGHADGAPVDVSHAKRGVFLEEYVPVFRMLQALAL